MRKVRDYKTSLSFSLLLFLALMLVSCGYISKKTMQETFLRENPTYTILGSETGEGWDGVAYHHFVYKKPNDEKVYKVMWCFEQQEDGNWKVTGKAEE